MCQPSRPSPNSSFCGNQFRQLVFFVYCILKCHLTWTIGVSMDESSFQAWFLSTISRKSLTIWRNIELILSLSAMFYMLLPMSKLIVARYSFLTHGPTKTSITPAIRGMTSAPTSMATWKQFIISRNKTAIWKYSLALEDGLIRLHSIQLLLIQPSEQDLLRALSKSWRIMDWTGLTWTTNIPGTMNKLVVMLNCWRRWGSS